MVRAMPLADAARTRERRVVIGGTIVVTVALLVSDVLLPFARQWSGREDAIATTRDRVAVLSGLDAARPSLDAEASRAEADLSRQGTRVLHARSLALAASALQSLLQDAADASHLVVTRLDVVQNGGAAANAGVATSPGDSASSPTVRLPATLAAYCDIVGLAALLDHLAHSSRVVRIEKLTVQQNSALRGAPDMLQITMSLRAPVVLE